MAEIYALVQWEDMFVSVIKVVSILEPRKETNLYKPGEKIKAKYRGRPYEAVISELNDDRKYLDNKAKKGQLNHRYLPVVVPAASNPINIIDSEQSSERTRNKKDVEKRPAEQQSIDAPSPKRSYIHSIDSEQFSSERTSNEKDAEKRPPQQQSILVDAPSPKRSNIHSAVNLDESIHQEPGSSLADSSEESEKEPHTKYDDTSLLPLVTKERDIVSNKNCEKRITALEKEVEELKSELRRFKRRVRVLEQEGEKPKETPVQQKEDAATYNGHSKASLCSFVEKLRFNEAVDMLLRKLFSLEEICGSSFSGKVSSKCGPDGPRPAMDQKNVHIMEEVLRGSFGEAFTRKAMVEKVQNIQKVERKKAKKHSVSFSTMA